MATQQARSALGGSVEAKDGRFLRLVFRLDAVATGAVGVLVLLAAGIVVGDGRPFVALLGTPLSLLVPVGLFLMVYAGFVWIIGSRRLVSGSACWAAVAINAACVVGCVVVVAAGWFPLTALGVVFVLVQAVAVALFAGLQFIGLRRRRPAVLG